MRLIEGILAMILCRKSMKTGLFYVNQTNKNTQYRVVRRNRNHDGYTKADFILHETGLKSKVYPEPLRIV